MVDDLIGVKFAKRGRDVTSGLDCWGLVMEVHRRYGIVMPDLYNGLYIGKWEEILEPTNKDVPLVVLMKIHPILTIHAGVYIGNNRIIHTMESTGVIISKASVLKTQIVGYYHYVPDN